MKIPNPFKEFKSAKSTTSPTPPEFADLTDETPPHVSGATGGKESPGQRTSSPTPWYLDPDLPSTPVEIHILDDCTYTPGSLSFL